MLSSRTLDYFHNTPGGRRDFPAGPLFSYRGKRELAAIPLSDFRVSRRKDLWEQYSRKGFSLDSLLGGGQGELD